MHVNTTYMHTKSYVHIEMHTTQCKKCILYCTYRASISLRDPTCLLAASSSFAFPASLVLRLSAFFCHLLLSSHRSTSREECYRAGWRGGREREREEREDGWEEEKNWME